MKSLEPTPHVAASAPRAGAGEVQTAMLMMVAATLILPGIDAIAKFLAASVSAGQVTWIRFLCQSVLMLPLVLRLPGPLFQPGLAVHLARGSLLAVTTVLFFYGLKFLPIADAIAIFFVEPLVLTVLSAVLLGEPIGWRRIAAVLVGLGGALIVIRPAFAALGWAALLPLGAALTFSGYLILTRRLAGRSEPVRMQFYAGLFGAGVMTLALAVGGAADLEAIDLSWPSPTEWALLGALGVIATYGHLLIVQAFRRAAASVLAPFQYVEIVGATAYGFLVFDDLPDAPTWLGIAIIVGSGLYVFHRERERGITPPPAAGTTAP